MPVRADLEKEAELASVSVRKPVAAVNSDFESIAAGGEPFENGYEDGCNNSDIKWHAKADLRLL